ncbi:hypothetical protein [Limosilactobacillus sp.]|jgi:hypothetical protein|uniref:hypothetical protein n=1 Tax=Limosilactobacillus sp. TaxID=2773925 RepID=UPI0025C266E5|nr:hypothetical protein [Limosilactobacillus sp.]MCH3923257.1 hypothetical protein [Limosilactobacillus sp.]MCH3927939.1 hypothetical protein [Limosilactobacillus sp.]
MHAIVRQENGSHYLSMVFGHYQDRQRSDDSFYYDYWIVWDAKKKRLIKWLTFQPDSQFLKTQILIVDSDQSDWNLNEDGEGCVNFLSRDLLDSITEKRNQPQNILNQCRNIDRGYVYGEIHEIKTQRDIEDLDWAVGNFHDARIKKEKLQDDGQLYLKFDGIWGCDLEVWFWGDLEYDTSSRDPETTDPYWFDATILLQDGFVYLVDEEGMTVEEITADYCYFKARHMKYHIIPK